MQKICKKYAKICNKICINMQKYANKICKNMQNICKNIRVYVFAYGAYICTPHFADVICTYIKIYCVIFCIDITTCPNRYISQYKWL